MMLRLMSPTSWLQSALVHALAILPLVLICRSQAPPPAPDAAAGAPPAAGGPAPPADPPENIFPNLKAWHTDFSNRLDILNKTIAVTPVDDEETKKMKLGAQEVTRTIGMRLSEPKMMTNRNQRIIANQLADLEEKLSQAGRKLFGIKWNSIPCGAGFAQAQCGNFAPCVPPAA